MKITLSLSKKLEYSLKEILRKQFDTSYQIVMQNIAIVHPRMKFNTQEQFSFS